MLKVAIHSGFLDTTSRFNRLAWLDIGYERLDAIAEYKVVLFQNGTGASAPVPIYNYPRWSASLWDLVARSIALTLRDNADCLDELMPDVVSTRKRSAFASAICATVEHQPSHGGGGRTLATVEVSQSGKRGHYTARFKEDGWPVLNSEPFAFQPDVLRPAELVLHAAVMRLHGKQEMPPRPALLTPSPVMRDGIEHVKVKTLPAHTRYGFLHWLRHTEGSVPDDEVVSALHYIRFLKEAV